MITRKTTKQYKRIVRSFEGRLHNDKHWEQVQRETWWFLFVPIYSREWILASNI